MVNEEPVQPRDFAMMGMLRSLGIEKGKEFKPDAATKAALNLAIKEAHAWLMDRLVTYGVRWWPDGKWEIPAPPIAAATGFRFEDANQFDVDARGIGYFSFYAPPMKLGAWRGNGWWDGPPEARFAVDSSLEEAGFEPSVPP